MTDEPEDYAPASSLLLAILKEEREVSEANLDEVIALTRDADTSNRDWALLLLAQSELDGDKVRAALAAGMDDPHHEAGLEALIGVAKREPARALPRVRELLERETVDSMALEAAAYVADASLLPALEAIRAETPDDGDVWEEFLAEAIAACTRGTPPDAI